MCDSTIIIIDTAQSEGFSLYNNLKVIYSFLKLNNVNLKVVAKNSLNNFITHTQGKQITI